MVKWSILQHLRSNQKLYNNFLGVVRITCAEWIERNYYQLQPLEFQTALCLELQGMTLSPANNLNQLIPNLQSMNSHDLNKEIRHLFDEEVKLLLAQLAQLSADVANSIRSICMYQQNNDSYLKRKECLERKQSLEWPHLGGNISVDQLLNDVVVSQEIAEIKSHIQSGADIIKDLLTTTQNSFIGSIELLEALKMDILNQLYQWSSNSIFSGSRELLPLPHLNSIQMACESIAYWLDHLIENVSIVQNTYPNSEWPSYDHKLANILNEILLKAFIIEEQPPEVIKTKTNWKGTVKVRHLLVNRLKHLIGSAFKVTVHLVNEIEARNLCQNQEPLDNDGWNQRCGSGILVGESEWQLDESNQQLFALFEHFQIDVTIPQESNARVAERKYGLVFNTWISQCQNLWVISAPLAIVSHTSLQGNKAYGEIVWNRFLGGRGPKQIPFEESTIANWNDIEEVLNTKWRQAIGVGLTQANLNALRKKIPGNRNDSYIITKSQFCQEKIGSMGKVAFTFWDWFYAAMRLVKNDKHLKPHWQNGTIHGFIGSQAETREILAHSGFPEGVFLLRFSDSTLGAISYARIGRDGELLMCKPFGSEILKKTCLDDLVLRKTELSHLYPMNPSQQPIKKNFIFKPSKNFAIRVPFVGYKENIE